MHHQEIKTKNKRCRYISSQGLLALLVVGLISGCTLSPSGRRSSKDHAFIVYWPPPENSSGLRLAVKDLIDMQGVGTTAGSGYVAKTSPPAARDAQCLELARERNVVYWAS